jgi:hypothetical protein
VFAKSRDDPLVEPNLRASEFLQGMAGTTAAGGGVPSSDIRQLSSSFPFDESLPFSKLQFL